MKLYDNGVKIAVIGRRSGSHIQIGADMAILESV
jgi:hypothetical protein